MAWILACVLLTASLTDSLVNLCTSVIGDLGIAGVFVLMLVESACIPIPAEATMLFAGFAASQGRFSLPVVVAAGVLGNLAGSLIAYTIGRYGREAVLRRYGATRSHRHLQWADAWFSHWGAAAVLICRMLPFVRSFISLPAGSARMRLFRFTALTTIGCIPFVWFLAAIGEQVGRNWSTLRSGFAYGDYVMVAAVVLAAAWLAVRRPWLRTPRT